MYDYEKKHFDQVRHVAPECMVLLKKNGDFPLSQPEKIALYGSGARQTIKGGTGSGDVNSRFYVSVEQGLESAGCTITTKEWLNAYDVIREEAKEEFIARIKQEAKERHVLAVMYGMGAVMPEPEYELPMNGEGETAVYVLSRISGEGSDRKSVEGDLLLSKTEVRDILYLQEHYTRFLLVLNVGGPVDLSPVQAVENVLLLSQLGVATGDALADVILGKAEPSGKLTTTWTDWNSYPKIGEFGQQDDTRYYEGIYVGYRYFDAAQVTPLYPFGYGLGYTDFALDKANVSTQGTCVTVEVPVRNVGEHPGRETVQVYVSAPSGRLDQPYQALAGFGKSIRLHPGESSSVTVTFAMEDLASYDENAVAWVLEAGDYLIRVGNSSRNTTLSGVIRLAEDVCVRKVHSVGGTPDFQDWTPPAMETETLPEDLRVLTMQADAFSTLSWPQPWSCSQYTEGVVSTLSDEQLVHLSMGLFAKGPTSIIGNAAQTVAGAAGETYGKINGLPGLVMADGPAGLRLNQKYTRDKKGIPHAIGNTFPAGMDDYLPGIAQKFLNFTNNRQPKGEVFEQYCTAIPIGTALAQSWNIDLVESCGDLVGEEMERFGVHLWLAPAFNIHRNVLCGRNFEYYSEDPLLSGKMGAAITRGVQRHSGCGTTVKHFCCNNQETNRLASNSVVSQRALREIYLRAFQICIREADPAALMTSYNLLNGVHTSERVDLLQTVLREEWGYRGLIMTDWVVPGLGKAGKHRFAKSAPSIAAGNVFMPGSQGDFNAAVNAMHGKNKDFTLSRKDAERCAAQVVELVRRLILERKH